MSDPAIRAKRPLSPHLQIYKPQISSTLSILHRITGVAMAIGTLMLVWLLVAAAIGEHAYDQFMWFAGSPLGLFMLFGWSFALFYHLCNGVRHLIWDTGRLFNLSCARKAGIMVVCVAIAMTALTWYCAYNF
ncbi:MAG: succinate dehydrogenase, cytochrome b556 subunit [Alphaproteobacteria bacterium]